MQLSLGECRTGIAPLVGCAGLVTGTVQCVGQPPERYARGEDQQRCESCQGCPFSGVVRLVVDRTIKKMFGIYHRSSTIVPTAIITPEKRFKRGPLEPCGTLG